MVQYHGPGRPKDLDTISDSDIVVTTYNTLTAEFLIRSKPSILHHMGWYRVVLDEGKPHHPFHFPRAHLTAFSTYHPPPSHSLLPILRPPPRQLTMVSHRHAHPKQTCRHRRALRLHPRRAVLQSLRLPEVD